LKRSYFIQMIDPSLKKLQRSITQQKQFWKQISDKTDEISKSSSKFVQNIKENLNYYQMFIHNCFTLFSQNDFCENHSLEYLISIFNKFENNSDLTNLNYLCQNLKLDELKEIEKNFGKTKIDPHLENLKKIKEESFDKYTENILVTILIINLLYNFL